MSAQTSIYDLADVRRIAQTGNINLERNANRDSRNHMFFDQDIVRCLGMLTPENFYKRLAYDLGNGKRIEFDVYKIVCPNSNADDIPMYVKLRISANNWIFIGSFKPE
ncbi:MAG: type II toxin-antitoxin system MqsR family toxin [Thiogranum sp.]|nr:type II toxin-antitoxin system MqsR family toxin [Thiogranum sp.]